MALTRTAWTDDDGTGTTGTILNNAEKQALYDQIDARWSETTITSTGTQNNLTYSEADRIRANNATALTLTGITAPASPAKPGKLLVIASVGAGSVVLNNEDAGSSAANRIITGTGAALTLAAGTGWAVLVYDDTSDRWRVLGSSAAAASAPGVTTSTVTGAQNNWAPTLSTSTLIEWSGASDAAFTGLAGGSTGRIVTIKNTGTKIATFAHQSGSSSAGNKFTNIVTSGVTPIAPGGSITYQYDGTDWQLIAHAQGGYIDIPYASGNFTAQAGTWTVESGDLVTMAYLLRGREVFFKVKILSSTTSVATNYLDIALPYTCARSEYAALSWGAQPGYIQTLPEFDTGHSSVLRMYKFDSTQWAAATNGIHLSLSHNYLTS